MAFHLGWLRTVRPDDAPLLARLAEALAWSGRKEEAMKHAARAFLIDPGVRLRLEAP
jgi:hypothetical protein